jgi:hypothetical protein
LSTFAGFATNPNFTFIMVVVTLLTIRANESGDGNSLTTPPRKADMPEWHAGEPGLSQSNRHASVDQRCPIHHFAVLAISRAG